jgi:hypothetical protein
MEKPDYKNYTLAELNDAHANIDKSKFPERADAIENEISARQCYNNELNSEQPLLPGKKVNKNYDISSMNTWLIRLTVILQIGGSFLGIIASITNVVQTQYETGTIILTIPVIAFLVFGIYSALLLIERNSRGLDYSIVFYFVQIPVLTSPLISFYIHAGAYFTLTLSIFRINFNYMLGSVWYISFLKHGESFSIGINLVAVLFFLLLDKSKNNLVSARSGN